MPIYHNSVDKFMSYSNYNSLLDSYIFHIGLRNMYKQLYSINVEFCMILGISQFDSSWYDFLR